MRRGPSAASRRQSARRSVRSTGPWLAPRERAASLLVVEVLLLFGVAEIGALDPVRHDLLVEVLGDRRLGLVDVDRLRQLGRLAALARRLAHRREVGVRRLLLIGSALGTDRLAFAEIVELRPAAEALELRTQLELRHVRLPPLRSGTGPEGGKLASARGPVNRRRALLNSEAGRQGDSPSHQPHPTSLRGSVSSEPRASSHGRTP